MSNLIRRIIRYLDPNVLDSREELRNHIFSTYLWMRTGMILIAFVFPFLLVIMGELAHNLPWQDSMSAYYWAPLEGAESGDAPMRIFFVGLLFALSCCLILYKGYTGFENWVLNIAGICAICVALVPMCKPESECQGFSWHAFFAFGFFGLLAVVAVLNALYAWGGLRRRPDQRPEDQQPHHIYAWCYMATGAVMVLAPIGTWILFESHPRQTFWAEVAGISAFCIFWFVQIVQISRSGFDKELAQSKQEDAHGLDDKGSAVKSQPS